MRTRAVILAACALLAWAPTVRPQPTNLDGWDFHHVAFRDAGRRAHFGYEPPELTREDVERTAFFLRASDATRDAMLDLYNAYLEEHLAAWVRFAEEHADYRRFSDGKWTDASRDAFNAMYAALREEQASALEAFWEDARLVGPPEDDEGWRLVEMDLRRARDLLDLGVHYRRDMDLVPLVWGAVEDASLREALRPVLVAYLEDIDALMTERERALDALDEAYKVFSDARSEAMSTLPSDMAYRERMEAMRRAAPDERDAAMRTVERVFSIYRRLRAAHREHRASAEALLPGDLVEALSDRQRRRERVWPVDAAIDMSGVARALDRLMSVTPTASDDDDERAKRWRWMRPEPLTPAQRAEVERALEALGAAVIEAEERYEEEQEEISDRHGRAIDGPWHNAHVFSRTRMYVLVDTDSEGRPTDNRAEASAASLERRDRAVAEAEQEALDRLRPILTVRQRVTLAGER